METPKTGTERAVAFAFPELVDNSMSIDDDELSVISFDDCYLNGDLMQDGADASKENFGEVTKPSQKKGTISNDAVVDIANRGGQGGDENNSQCNEYLIDIEIPSTPPTPATTTSNVTTAHSEWLTPTLRREKQQPPAVARPRRVTLWECMCLAAIFFVLAICVSVIVVIVGRYGSSPDIGIGIGTEGVVEPPPTASPSLARLHRVEAIREWLQLDLPLPGTLTPQEAALEWMVSSDFSYILGATIPSKAEYNLYNQALVENANNNDEPVAYVNDEHKEMERFLFHVTQRYALLVFYFATGMESPLGGWATMTGARLHECIWPGVVCRSEDDAVKELELNPSVYGTAAPTGSIPSEIGMLEHIGTTARRCLFDVVVFYCYSRVLLLLYPSPVTLFLSHNLLTGAIPSEIYNLSNLCKSTENQMKALTIGSTFSLTHSILSNRTLLHTDALRISNSNLNSTLSSDFAKLDKLGFLDLSNAQFYGSLPSELGLMSNLKFVYVNDNRLDGTIPSEMGALTLLGTSFLLLLLSCICRAL